MLLQSPEIGKVIAMADFVKNDSNGVLAQVEGYWDALRNGRDMPKRSEVDPRGIAQALANAFICERIAPGIAKLRVAGSAMSDVLGMEVRGMPLGTFFTAKGRIAVEQAIESTLNSPLICMMDLTAETALGRPDLSARILLLPLQDDQGVPNRILGVMTTEGQLGRTPRRFDVAHTTSREITASIVRPKPRLQERKTPGISGELAEDAAVFRAAPKPNKQGSHLRLVSSR